MVGVCEVAIAPMMRITSRYVRAQSGRWRAGFARSKIVKVRPTEGIDFDRKNVDWYRQNTKTDCIIRTTWVGNNRFRLHGDGASVSSW
jgi:hypothetical protein